jgi:methylamine dehydrogenase accessory protein MauD
MVALRERARRGGRWGFGVSGMDALLLAGRLLLAAVFGLAGAMKLRDRAGTRRALGAFGVPDGLLAAATIALPAAELAIAAALLPTNSARYGARAALAPSLVFIAATAYNIARHRRPDCHCFGQLLSAPIGWQTIARGGLLSAVALGVAVAGWEHPGPSLVAWLAPLTPFERTVVIGGALALAFLCALCTLLLAVVHQNQRLIRHVTLPPAGIGPGQAASIEPHAARAAPMAGPPVGTVAPFFTLPTLDGGEVSLDDLRASGKPVVLLFSNPHCGACTALLPEIGHWQRATEHEMTLALISPGTAAENRAKSREHAIRHVLLQRDREVARAYAVSATPSAVLILPDGTIGRPLAPGGDAIRDLIGAVAPSATAPATDMGVPAQEHTNGGIQPYATATPLALDTIPIRDGCVRDDFLTDGRITLYNACTRQTLTLNPTAALVWECCDGAHDIAAIVAEVREVFPHAPDAEGDVRALLTALADARMIARETG